MLHFSDDVMNIGKGGNGRGNACAVIVPTVNLAEL